MYNLSKATIGKLDSAPLCPKCKKILDGFTHLSEDVRPKSGDISVCSYCAEILQFDDNLNLIHADADNLAQVDFIELQAIHKVVAGLRKMRAENARSH